MRTICTTILLLLYFNLSNGLSKPISTNTPTSSKSGLNHLKTMLNEEIEVIKNFEEFRATPYRDMDGALLIGYGFKKKFHFKPNRISKSQADSILETLVTELYKRAKVRFPKESDKRLVKIAHIYYWVGERRTHRLNIVTKKGYDLNGLTYKNLKRINYFNGKQ